MSLQVPKITASSVFHTSITTLVVPDMHHAWHLHLKSSPAASHTYNQAPKPHNPITSPRFYNASTWQTGEKLPLPPPLLILPFPPPTKQENTTNTTLPSASPIIGLIFIVVISILAYFFSPKGENQTYVFLFPLPLPLKIGRNECVCAVDWTWQETSVKNGLVEKLT